MTTILDLASMLRVYREDGFEGVPIQHDEMLTALIQAYNQALKDVSDKLYRDTGYGSVEMSLDYVKNSLNELKLKV